MQKLQNEQLLPKINQFLCLLRVSGMGLSWCLGYKGAFGAAPVAQQHLQGGLQLPQPKLE